MAGRPNPENQLTTWSDRGFVRLSIRFARASAGASLAGDLPGIDAAALAADASRSHLEYLLTPGVSATFSADTERTSPRLVVAPGTSDTLQTSEERVSAGMSLTAFVGLGAGRVTCESTISISSFTGAEGTGRNTTTVPVVGDYPAGSWVPVAHLSTLDARVKASLIPLGLDLGGGVSGIWVLVRFDPVLVESPQDFSGEQEPN